MGERRQAVTYFQFQGGLNTDASLLNIEPQDSTDMSNMVLGLDGTARRRPAVGFLGPRSVDGEYYHVDDTDMTLDSAVGDYQDPAPSALRFTVTSDVGDTNTYLITHIGKYLYIYLIETYESLTDTDEYVQKIEIPTTDTRAYHTKTTLLYDDSKVFCVNPYYPLSYIKYNQETELFELNAQQVFVRELEGDVPFDKYLNHNGKQYKCILSHGKLEDNASEPGVGEFWEQYWELVGEEDTELDSWASASGSSDVSTESGFFGRYDNWRCIVSHTSVVGDQRVSGSLTLDKWQKLDTTKEQKNPLWEAGVAYVAESEGVAYTSNITRLEWEGSDNTGSGFSTGCFATGRLWLAGHPIHKNRVYFSQTVTKETSYGRMYQWADPFNDLDSAIVDTDGGYITITGADEIRQLVPYKAGTIVAASNGVWFIGGDTGIFRATDYSIEKISEDGVICKNGVVIVEDKVVYFGHSNVYAIGGDVSYSSPLPTAIGSKIKSFWTGIPLYNRVAGKAMYNHDSKELYFLTNFTDQSWFATRNPYVANTRSRDMLVFNTSLEAWYKYQLASDSDGSAVTIGDMFLITGGKSGLFTITDEEGAIVQDESDNTVITYNTADANYETVTTLLLHKQEGDNIKFSFGELYGTGFQDFADVEDDSASYTSYIEAAPQIFADIGHRKQVPYLYTAFQYVEQGYDTDADEYINPGACNYRVSWDWANSSASAKQGALYPAYKPTKWNIAYADGRNSGYSIVYGKHRIRGSGHAVQFRFESDGDRDFHIVGWQLSISGNPRD